MTDCIFCNIAAGEVPAEMIKKTPQVVVFKDNKPKAPVHLLIVPRKHVESIVHLQDADRGLVSDMVYTAKEVAAEQNLMGYQLSINVGRDGGQIVDHLHMHLVGGWNQKV